MEKDFYFGLYAVDNVECVPFAALPYYHNTKDRGVQ